MVTFLHISDIHFRNRDHGTAFDLDQQIRRALLEDVERRPADGVGYDGVLITGDIAFSGQHDEYKIAQDFLDDLFKCSGASATTTYMVPGNHDVDRRFVEPDLPLWAAHEKLRASTDPGVWRDHIYKQLVKDPQRSLLAPLKAYNDFAQKYGCFTGMLPTTPGQPDVPQLAWQKIFEKPLEDGTLIRLNGLNSALISDSGDGPGGLLVSDFQTSHFARAPKVVDLVMCHHPPEWLMDKVLIRNVLSTFAPVALFGHEHDTRIDANNKEVHLFAGAVQPSRRDPAGWLPTYHVLQLSVESTDLKRELVVKIFTREYTTNAPIRFRARMNENESPVEVCRIMLPLLKQAENAANSVAHVNNPGVQSIEESVMSAPEPKAPTQMETAQHELLVHFFQLPTPLRYKAAFTAGLLRDGDDALDPQIMWAEVFRRAIDENHLAEFWSAVATHSPKLQRDNPFTPTAHAQ